MSEDLAGSAVGRVGPQFVVGVDGSAESSGALRWALYEARRRGGELLAVTAWPGGPERERLECEELLLRRVAAAIAETGVHGRTRARLLVGDPALVLEALAEDADVLVLGEHAAPGMSRSLGSVAARGSSESAGSLPLHVEGPA